MSNIAGFFGFEDKGPMIQQQEKKIENLKAKNKSLKESVQNQNKRIQKQIGKIKKAKDQVRELQGKVNKLPQGSQEDYVQEILTQNDNMNAELSELKKELEKAKSEIGSLRNENETLKAQQATSGTDMNSVLTPEGSPPLDHELSKKLMDRANLGWKNTLRELLYPWKVLEYGHALAPYIKEIRLATEPARARYAQLDGLSANEKFEAVKDFIDGWGFENSPKELFIAMAEDPKLQEFALKYPELIKHLSNAPTGNK